MATMPGHAHLACSACGASERVNISIRELPHDGPGQKLELDLTNARRWVAAHHEAHHEPYLVPIKACEDDL